MPHLYTNSLIHESSPYLLQHAHNPVQWHAWNIETLQKAKELQKPLLVSIGYAACHWCHVMEKESFEDEAVAAFMNANFINIKIDREERPDIDHLYMDAVQAMTGSGGWPLNVFINPEGKPFYGGTYFPPEKAFNRPSWMDVLTAIASAWEHRRDDLEAQASQLTAQLETSGNIFSSDKLKEKLKEQVTGSDKDLCKTIAKNLLKTADTFEGGFGKAPKFPQTFSILYLLQYAHFFGESQALAHAELSLQKMLNGGIYDQLCGGLSRYSTDANWLAPHFEKMLYDNALFITVLCDAWQLTRKDIYLNAIETTINFINAEMRDENGGFYAALDADSEGEEGKFYVWQQDEINELLGDQAALFSAYYNLTQEGNWEHKNILHIKIPASLVAAKYGIEEHEIINIINDCKIILRDERLKRKRPQTDDKILLGWNALMLTAFCKAYACTGKESYKRSAEDLFAFIVLKFSGSEDGALYHTYKNGRAKYPAFLDDYSFLIEAAIYLQEITANQDYLLKARTWLKYVMENFSGDAETFFYFTGIFQDDIVVRKQEIYDGAIPSSNAVMAKNLLYLGRIYDDKAWIEKALGMIIQIREIVVKYPGSFGVWAQLILQETVGINEIVITGSDPEPMLKQVLEIYIPNKILQSHHIETSFPLLKSKDYDAVTKIYLCKNYHCQSPVTTKDGLITVLEKVNY